MRIPCNGILATFLIEMINETKQVLLFSEEETIKGHVLAQFVSLPTNPVIVIVIVSADLELWDLHFVVVSVGGKGQCADQKQESVRSLSLPAILFRLHGAQFFQIPIVRRLAKIIECFHPSAGA